MPETAQRPMVFIATPCFGGLVSQHYMQSILSLMQFAGPAGFDAALALLGHDSLITRSRNTLVSQFLQTPGASHLLFIDADISFEAEQVFHMLSFDQDFVAGVYPLKVIDWSHAAIKRAATRTESFEAAPLLYVGSACADAERARDGRFATAIYCGGGFMLLKRRVIERMIEAYPETRYANVHAYSNAARGGSSYALFDCMIDRHTSAYVSEDFGFCQRWRDIGGTIWLDTLGRLTHSGSYNFQGDPGPRFLSAGALADARGVHGSSPPAERPARAPPAKRSRQGVIPNAIACGSGGLRGEPFAARLMRRAEAAARPPNPPDPSRTANPARAPASTLVY